MRANLARGNTLLRKTVLSRYFSSNWKYLSGQSPDLHIS
jgi:hypothetical protein